MQGGWHVPWPHGARGPQQTAVQARVQPQAWPGDRSDRALHPRIGGNRLATLGRWKESGGWVLEQGVWDRSQIGTNFENASGNLVG